jgi:hypothetical protein
MTPNQGSAPWNDDADDGDNGLQFLDAARFSSAIQLGDETAAKIQRAWRLHASTAQFN